MSTKYVHTNIISKEWKALADFYINAFGCKIVTPERDLSGDWLDKGTKVKNAHIQGTHLLLPGYGENGPTLEIYQYAENEKRASSLKANTEGFGHIAFHVDDVAEMLEIIIKFGGKKLGEIVTQDFTNRRLVFTYATDPEGNIVEIQNWNLM
jgi:predicted enzyme related to lactoylglutathione lyase